MQTVIYSLFRQGILDVFLAVIAKALTVQLKAKGSENPKSMASQNKSGVTSVNLSSVMPLPASSSPRWWLRGSATKKQADLIINLIRDMTMVGWFTGCSCWGVMCNIYGSLLSVLFCFTEQMVIATLFIDPTINLLILCFVH